MRGGWSKRAACHIVAHRCREASRNRWRVSCRLLEPISLAHHREAWNCCRFRVVRTRWPDPLVVKGVCLSLLIAIECDFAILRVLRPTCRWSRLKFGPRTNEVPRLEHRIDASVRGRTLGPEWRT